MSRLINWRGSSKSMYGYNWFIGHIEHSVWVVHFLYDFFKFFLAKLGRKKFLSRLRNYFSNRRVE